MKFRVKRGLVDTSSVVWTCLKAGEDTENGIPQNNPDGTPMVRPKSGKRVIVNSGRYGYDNAINHLLSVMKELGLQPFQLVFVVEGRNSKAGRQAILSTYKGGSDKLPDEYAQFIIARDMLINAFLALGSQVVTQDGVEGDDVIGYLAQKLKGETWVITHGLTNLPEEDDNYIVTGDKDLIQCMSDRVHLHSQGRTDHNRLGPFDPKYVPLYLALVGDSSDKIPGAKLFGPKSFEELLVKFGEEGLDALEKLIRDQALGRLREDVAEMPSLQKIIDSASDVYKSYACARLRTEHVNTRDNPLQWRVGLCRQRDQIEDASLYRYAGTTQLVSAENFDDCLSFFEKTVKHSPWVAFDIETSTPDESDEWLEAQDKEEKVVDTLGSTLTGFSITFGPNLNHTFYVTVDHVQTEGVTNITKAQAKRLIQAIPKDKINWVHNFAFEGPVIKQELGDMNVA